MTADVAGIVSGTITREQALWQVGRELLGHTNNLLAIAAGSKRPFSNEGGGRSTNLDAAQLEHGPKGVWISLTTWRAPRTDAESHIARVLQDDDELTTPETETVWTAKWSELSDIVKPYLTGDLLDEIHDAAAARSLFIGAQPPPWKVKPSKTEDSAARNRAWFEIENRCRAATEAVWMAAKTEVDGQLELFEVSS